MIRKILIQGLKVAISAFLIGFLIHRIGIEKVVEHISTAHKGWLFCAIVLFFLSHLFGNCQWWILLRSENISISWGKTLSFYFVGLFFNNFFISTLGGDLFRMYDIRRYARNGPAAVSTVFLDRFMGLLALSCLAVLVSLFIILRLGKSLELLVPCGVLFLGWILIGFSLFYKPFTRSFAWVLRKLIPGGMVVKIREVYRKIHDFGRKSGLFFLVFVISLVLQSIRIMTHYLLAVSLGISISPVYFFLIVPILTVVTSLPVSVGGIGIREQTGVILFGIVGMTALQAFSVEFLAYLVGIVSTLPGGVIFLIRRRVEYRSLESQKAT